MTYLIRYGSIAAVQYITLPDGSTATAVYVSHRTMDVSLDSTGRACQLPMGVMLALQKRFQEVFAVVASEREPIVRRMQPVMVEA